jgi:hypothetical protein
MLTKNYTKLSKNFNSVGCLVHESNKDEFINITIQRTVDDADFVHVNGEERVSVRLNIGKNDAPLYYKFSVDLDTFKIHNIPIYAGEEAWIAISKPNTYCVFGNASKYSFPK